LSDPGYGRAPAPWLADARWPVLAWPSRAGPLGGASSFGLVHHLRSECHLKRGKLPLTTLAVPANPSPATSIVTTKARVIGMAAE